MTVYDYLKRAGEEAIMSYPGIHLEELRKVMRRHSQDS
jgi:hypothetical protein